MGQEYELKYRANDRAVAAIREKFSGFTSITMETTYFDTPSRALSQRKWMLRRRLENGVAVCTLKTPGKDGARGEWETESTDMGKAVLKLCKLSAPEELLDLTAEGLIPICGARFTRLAAPVEGEGCTLELALDQGEFLAGEKHLPFAEVEVELKTGSRQAADAFGAALAEEFSLTPEEKSKAQRAFALANT